MVYWKHRELERGYVSYEPRRRAQIVDGVFEAPDDHAINRRLEEAGHECLGDTYDHDAAAQAKAEQEEQPEPGDLPVSELKGVGPKTEATLHQAGIHTAAELAEADPDEVSDTLVQEAATYLEDPEAYLDDDEDEGEGGD